MRLPRRKKHSRRSLKNKSKRKLRALIRRCSPRLNMTRVSEMLPSKLLLMPLSILETSTKRPRMRMKNFLKKSDK